MGKDKTILNSTEKTELLIFSGVSLTKNDLNAHQKDCFFAGLIKGKLISLAYGGSGKGNHSSGVRS